MRKIKLTDVKDILLLYDSKCEKQAIEMFIKQNKEKQIEDIVFQTLCRVCKSRSGPRVN